MLPCLCWPTQMFCVGQNAKHLPSVFFFFFCCTDAHFHGGACNCQTINLWFKFHFSDRNSTAVCIYSMETIEDIFERSSFKGYNKDIPHPRPGTVKTSLASAQRWKTFVFISSSVLVCNAFIEAFCRSSLLSLDIDDVHAMSQCLETWFRFIRWQCKREGFFYFFSSNQFSCSSRNWRKLWKGPVQ